MLTLKKPFSNLQEQLLKLYAADIPDEKLKELSELIASYLLDQARNEADKIWLKKKYGARELKSWISNVK